MSEWQIDPASYFERLGLNIENFEQSLQLPNLKKIDIIIPLRDIKNIHSIIPIRVELLSHLLRRVKTLDNKLPFKEANFKMIKIDPRQTKIGQKFIYRENYQNLLEEVPDMFNEFLITTGGLSNLGAYFVFGTTKDDLKGLACYIPPLIEKHGPELIIMDGIHRNYIEKQAGSALNAILIENINAPFPCSIRDWSKIKVISLTDKPKDVNKRYFDLCKELFRDLKYLGIDG